MRRLEAIQKFGGGHTNGNEDRNTIHTAIGRKGGSIKHKKDQERKKKGHGADPNSQSKDSKPVPRKRHMSIGKAALYDTFTERPDFKSFPTGITGIICSVQARLCSRGTSASSRRAP